MVSYQTETKTGGFFKYGRIQILTGKSLERCIDCRIQKTFITNAIRAA